MGKASRKKQERYAGVDGLGRPLFAEPDDAPATLAGVPLSRPWIGIRYTTLDRRTAAQNNLSIFQGAWLTPGTEPAVVPGSPAEAAGFADGDIVVKVQGEAIDELHPLQDLLVQYSPGTTIVLDVLRGESMIQLSVTLGTRPNQ